MGSKRSVTFADVYARCAASVRCYPVAGKTSAPTKAIAHARIHELRIPDAADMLAALGLPLVTPGCEICDSENQAPA